MNELKVFNNENLGQVRVVDQNGEPWFVAKDICDVFGETNRNRAMQNLGADEKGYTQTITPGGMQETAIVSESGLYALLFAMQPTKARGVTEEYIADREQKLTQFRRWVTHEVLPTIRKHGAYMTADTIEKTLTDPDYLIRLATTLKEEMQRRIVAEKQIEEQKPLILFAEACIASNDSILVRELAKLASKNGIVIGEKKLYKKLREWDLILKTKNEPSQRGMDMYLFEVKKGTYTTPYGSEPFATLKVTPKGQVYIIEKLRKLA